LVPRLVRHRERVRVLLRVLVTCWAHSIAFRSTRVESQKRNVAHAVRNVAGGGHMTNRGER
jgi:hypothetical protein